MLRFISFGSGSSGNCYFLYTEHEGLLIDTGVGIRTLKKEFRDYGLTLSQIHYVLITHDHADHIKCVGSLSHDFHLPVYATATVHKGIQRSYYVQRKLEPYLRHEVETGKSYTLGEFCITPFAVPPNHDIEMLQQGPYPDYLKVRILSKMGHLSNAACGEAIAQNRQEHLRHVWLCHLSEENNHPELARKTVESILTNSGINVGSDLELEVLKRTQPTGIFELPLPEAATRHQEQV